MVARDADVDRGILWGGIGGLGGDKIIDKKMKKEVLKIKEVFDRFPEADRVWVSTRGNVYLDSTREEGLTMVKRSDIDNETKEDKQ